MPQIMLHQSRSRRQVNRCTDYGTCHHVSVNLRTGKTEQTRKQTHIYDDGGGMGGRVPVPVDVF
jgi:hypothetical protein